MTHQIAHDEEIFYDAKEYEYEVALRCSTNNSVRRRRAPKRTTFISEIKPLPAIAEEEEEEEPAEQDEEHEDEFFNAEQYEEQDEDDEFYDAKEYEFAFEIQGRVQQNNNTTSSSNSMPRQRKPLASIDEEKVWYACVSNTIYIYFAAKEPLSDEEQGEPHTPEYDIQLHETIKMFDLTVPLETIPEEPDEIINEEQDEIPSYVTDSESNDEDRDDEEGQVQQNNNTTSSSNSMPRQRKPLASIDEEKVWYACVSNTIYIYFAAKEPLSDEEQGEPHTPEYDIQLHETIKMFDLTVPLETIPEEPDEIINEEQDEIPSYVTDSESNDEDRDDDEQDQEQEQGAPLLPSPPQQLRRRSLRIAANTSVPTPTLSPPTLPLLRRSPRLAHMPRVSYVGMC